MARSLPVFITLGALLGLLLTTFDLTVHLKTPLRLPNRRLVANRDGGESGLASSDVKQEEINNATDDDEGERESDVVLDDQDQEKKNIKKDEAGQEQKHAGEEQIETHQPGQDHKRTEVEDEHVTEKVGKEDSGHAEQQNKSQLEIQMDPDDEARFPREYYACIDDIRVNTSFTNKTCVTRAMLLEGSGHRPAFYVACGAEAMLRKDVEFEDLSKVIKKLLKLVLYATLAGVLPIMLSALVFQSISSPSSPGYQQVEEQSQPGALDTCKKAVGTLGMYVFVPAIMSVNLYTTFMTTRRVVFELMEFYGTLNYGKTCNFIMYLDYAMQGELLEVLTLAMFSWADLLFAVAKLVHDCGILTAAGCWGSCNILQYIVCCKWIPWDLLKTLCCCYGPVKCCVLLGQILLMYVCFLPLVAAALLLLVVLLASVVYSVGGVFLVVFVYGSLALLAGAALLLLIYIASLLPQAIMYCVKSRKISTPAEYFEYSVLAFVNDMKPGAPDVKDMCSLKGISAFVKSKFFAVVLPFATLFIVFSMHACAVGFLSTYEANWVDERKLAELQDKIQGSPWEVARLLWLGVQTSFRETNIFVVDNLVHRVEQIPALIHTMQAYLDPEAWMVAMSTLLDLGAKFHQFEKAVLMLRVSSGILTGPLRLFEVLASYDAVK